MVSWELAEACLKLLAACAHIKSEQQQGEREFVFVLACVNASILDTAFVRHNQMHLAAAGVV